jgi:DNA-directed RNA polymerase alpha subunit
MAYDKMQRQILEKLDRLEGLVLALSAHGKPAHVKPPDETLLDLSMMGLPSSAVTALEAAGMTTVGAIRAASDEELLALSGVGEKTVDSLRRAVG